MTNISDLTYEQRREKIISHIYTVNSHNQLYTSSIPSIPNDEILDELANCVSHLVDSPIFYDISLINGKIQKIKFKVDSMYFNSILKTDKSIKLYTVNSMNMIRFAFNDKLKTTLQQNDRGRKIDDLLNK